jgi:hypothetical protein
LLQQMLNQHGDNRYSAQAIDECKARAHQTRPFLFGCGQRWTGRQDRHAITPRRTPVHLP